MKLKNRFITLILFFCRLLITSDVYAQTYIDAITFGNTGDETLHKLKSELSDTYIGDRGEGARRFLPKSPIDYYGGETSFVMNVNPVKQNYFTVRLSGNEYNAAGGADNGRLILDCEGMEVGSRHGGDIDVFVNQSGEPVCPGAFWYRTIPLPLSLTKGKNTISIRIRSTGRFYSYGKPHNYDSYQRKLLYPTQGIYRAYTHINPYFSIPAGENQGAFPVYNNAPVRPGPGEEALEILKQRCNNKIKSLLKGTDYIIPYSNNNYNLIEYLAFAYTIPWTVGYHNPDIIQKVKRAIDSNCARYSHDSTLVHAWGGAYGRLGYAAAILYPQLKNCLDSTTDLGKGSLTRRAYWSAMLRASFDFGRYNRRTITNQDLEGTMSIYAANLGLLAIDPRHALPAAVAKRYIYEALGMEEWRGDDLPAGGSKWNFGRGYMMMTAKGTSHEPGWVSQDCYGNLGPKIFEMYKLCDNDTAILRRAVQLEKMQSYFRYPSVDTSGYRAMLAEGVICWRNEYHPGKVHYGDIWLAGETRDPSMQGYIQQMIDDGQFFYEISNITDVVYSGLLFLPQAYEHYKAILGSNVQNVKSPSTPGQPDYAVADEENGILAVKHGQEHFFLMLYRRADAINYLAKAHHITPDAEREIEFIEDDVRFLPSGKYKTVGSEVEDAYAGIPPDSPINAFRGQRQPIPLLPDGSIAGSNRAIAEFYGVHYGNYFIGMNTTNDKMFQWRVITGYRKAVDLVSGREIDLTGPVTVGPRSTLVFFLDQ